MTEPSPYLSVHKTRRAARKREREFQAWLDGAVPEAPECVRNTLLPSWMCGVKVARVGFRQFIVVATKNRGH